MVWACLSLLSLWRYHKELLNSSVLPFMILSIFWHPRGMSVLAFRGLLRDWNMTFPWEFWSFVPGEPGAGLCAVSLCQGRAGASTRAPKGPRTESVSLPLSFIPLASFSLPHHVPSSSGKHSFVLALPSLIDRLHCPGPKTFVPMAFIPSKWECHAHLKKKKRFLKLIPYRAVPLHKERKRERARESND